MKNNSQKGFTLIEMLVVIGMIGVLAATVLTALGPSRAKARDARVISGLNQLASIAEANFDGNSYPANDTAFQTKTGVDKVYADINSVVGVNPTYTAAASPSSAFMIYSKLSTVTTPTSYYCIDSLGTRKTIESASAPTGSVCP
ncbi:MAG: type II secretion system protein [Candidatus Jorgensenbacteria bacterium]|nr:type II secretion system protein [Candidatus Jorgensenbacteria bacterium]